MEQQRNKLLQIDQELKQINRKLVYADWMSTANTFCLAFWYRFTNQDNQKFFFTRNHIGSYAAFGMACHNTYYMKQSIIKQCIYLTKSNNPQTIKITRIPMTGFYFILLATLWHIPSFSAEISARLYYGISAGIFAAYVQPDQVFRQVTPRQILFQ